MRNGWPVSSPRKHQAAEPVDIDNPMEIMSGGVVVLVINWVVWIDAWRVVVSDPGTMGI